jgi:glycosyltransferase involved in cell wall biosynthesis
MRVNDEQVSNLMCKTKSVLLVCGIERRYSMDHYASDLNKSLRKLANAPKVTVIFLDSLIPKIFIKHRSLFLIYKYLILPFHFTWQLGNNIEIVHIVDHSYGYLMIAKYIKRIFGTKIAFFITVHDLIPLCYDMDNKPNQHSSRATLPYRFSIKCLNYADKIITPSEFSKDIISKITKINCHKIYVVPHGVQVEKCNAKPNMKRSLSSLKELKIGLLNGEFYKNWQFSLTLVKFLERSGYTIKVYVLGKKTKKFSDYLDNIKICSSVEFRTGLDSAQIYLYYDNLDIFLFPSKIEGLGQPLIEALLRKVPTFASDIAVFREITDNEYPLFPCVAEKEITNFLTIFTDELKSKKTFDLIQSSLERYDWDVAANQINSMYAIST